MTPEICNPATSRVAAKKRLTSGLSKRSWNIRITESHLTRPSLWAGNLNAALTGPAPSTPYPFLAMTAGWYQEVTPDNVSPRDASIFLVNGGDDRASDTIRQ